MSGTNSADAASIWLAYNEAENARDFEAMNALIQPQLHVSVNGRPAVSSADDDLRAMESLTSTYPDYRREVEEVLPAGDRAAVRWRMQGTPAPGSLAEPLDVPGCSIVECSDGAIASAHLYYDGTALDVVLASVQTKEDT